jgi:TDG/mug DNA glycosylase family protein
MSEEAILSTAVKNEDDKSSLLVTHYASLPGLPDIIAPDLALLFVGYNPSVHSSRRGHFYAGPGNQFWRLLWRAGLTPRIFTPEEDRELLALRIGITDLCPIPTPGIDDLPRAVAEAGREALTDKIERFQPRIVAFNGKATFERYFGRPPVSWGAQDRRIGNAPSLVYVTPSSSGRANGVQVDREAAYLGLGALVREMALTLPPAGGTPLPIVGEGKNPLRDRPPSRPPN